VVRRGYSSRPEVFLRGGGELVTFPVFSPKFTRKLPPYNNKKEIEAALQNSKILQYKRAVTEPSC